MRIGEAFLIGYHRALEGGGRSDGGAELVTAIAEEVPAGWRGFAHEGVGSGLALRDAVLPRVGRRPRLLAYLDGPAAPFQHTVLAGAGWSFARWPFGRRRTLAGIEPLVRWIVFDGYGFQRAFYAWRKTVDEGRVPRRLRGYARRAFDLGVGRCLWFGQGMEGEGIAGAIDRFPEARRSDLWSGVGLAATFAGGAAPAELMALREAAGRRSSDFRGDLAQGAAFAALMRVESGEVTAWSEAACPVLCGRSVEDAAARVREVRRGLPEPVGPAERNAAAGWNATASEPVYEVWRRRTRAALIRS